MAFRYDIYDHYGVNEDCIDSDGFFNVEAHVAEMMQKEFEKDFRRDEMEKEREAKNEAKLRTEQKTEDNQDSNPKEDQKSIEINEVTPLAKKKQKEEPKRKRQKNAITVKLIDKMDVADKVKLIVEKYNSLDKSIISEDMDSKRWQIEEVYSVRNKVFSTDAMTYEVRLNMPKTKEPELALRELTAFLDFLFKEKLSSYSSESMVGVKMNNDPLPGKIFCRIFSVPFVKKEKLSGIKFIAAMLNDAKLGLNLIFDINEKGDFIFAFEFDVTLTVVSPPENI